MGSDDHGKQELEAELLAQADRVVADSVSQCVDHGECFHAVQGRQIEESSILELGNVIKNPAIGRTSEDQITSGMDPRLNQTGPTLIVLAEHKPPVYDKTGIMKKILQQLLYLVLLAPIFPTTAAEKPK